LAIAIVSAAPAATESAPEDPLTVTVGPTIVSGSAAEVPPPGAGVTTVMLRDAVVATSPAAIGVVKDVLDRYDVALETPSSWICEFAAKPVPVTVSVNATFMTADAGLILVSTGAGGGELTVNVLPLEVPPPGAGVCTLMVRVARLARSAADSTAVSMVALLNVVGRASPSNR